MNSSDKLDLEVTYWFAIVQSPVYKVKVNLRQSIVYLSAQYMNLYTTASGYAASVIVPVATGNILSIPTPQLSKADHEPARQGVEVNHRDH